MEKLESDQQAKQPTPQQGSAPSTESTALGSSKASQPEQANKPSDSSAGDLFSHLRTGARSLAESGQELLKQMAKRQQASDSVNYLNETPDKNSVINMNATTPAFNKTGTSTSANQLIRQQLPSLTRQVLGKRFNTVNKIASLVMPEGSFDKASDQVLELLADFSSLISNSDHILSEAGVESLAKLQGDTERSGRLARALSEKNRYVAIAQGAISGATGVVGAASDIPFSMILALRTIYLTGRAYGFELDKAEDRGLVFEALSNADLSLITEKQAILLALRTLGNTLESGNLQNLQSLVGSSNDIEPLLKLLSDSSGQLKWKVSSTLISKVTPAIGGVVGAIYSARLLKEVSESANQIFSQARQHALGQGSTTEAKQEPLTIEDKIVNPVTPDSKEEKVAQEEAQQAILHNDDIEKVQVLSRKEHDKAELTDDAKDEQIHDKLSALADHLVTPHDHTTQKPAIPTAEESEEQDSDEVVAKKPRARKQKAADDTVDEEQSDNDQKDQQASEAKAATSTSKKSDAGSNDASNSKTDKNEE